MKQDKRKAITAFVLWCSFYGFAYVFSMVGWIYLVMTGHDTRLPFSPWVMGTLIFAVVIGSVAVMRYTYVKARKANLKWLKIVSMIFGIFFTAAFAVGLIGLLLSMIAQSRGGTL